MNERHFLSGDTAIDIEQTLSALVRPDQGAQLLFLGWERTHIGTIRRMISGDEMKRLNGLFGLSRLSVKTFS